MGLTFQMYIIHPGLKPLLRISGNNRPWLVKENSFPSCPNQERICEKILLEDNHKIINTQCFKNIHK